MDEITEQIPEPSLGEEGRKRVYKRRDLVNTAILANYGKPKSQRLKPRQLAEQLGCTVQAVYDQQNRLRAAGRLPTGDLPQADVLGSANIAGLDFDQMLERVQSGGDLTVEERRRVINYIMVAGQDQHRLAAGRLLNDIDSESKHGLGPSEPKSDEEIVARAARVLYAVGRALADRAMTVAFAVQPPETALGEVNGTASAAEASASVEAPLASAGDRSVA